MESHSENEGNVGCTLESLDVPLSTNGPISYPSASPRQVTGTTNAITARSLATSRRSRGGCNTCRKRKVKCDEGRPICGHCTRLNLVCDYDPTTAAGPREYTPRRQQKPRREAGPAQQRSPPTQRVSSSQVLLSPWTNHQEQQSSVLEIPHGVNTSRAESVAFDAAISTSIMPAGNSDEQTFDPVMQLSGPGAWELELLGEDSLWANLPIFANFMSVQDSESYGSAVGSNNTRVTLPATSYSESENARAQNPAQQETFSNAFALTDEITLLRHFVDFAVPPILVGVEPRWNSSRDTLLRLSKSNLPLRHAICAFSALSLGESPSTMPFTTAQSSTYYSDLAMTELRKLLDENEHSQQYRQRPPMNESRTLNDGDLPVKPAQKSSSDETILATIFFLSYIEIIVSSVPKNSLDLLNRAHFLMSNREGPNTTLYQQLQIWLKLLDAKVVSAGGEGVHLHTNPSTRDLEAVREIYGSSNANDEPNGSTLDASVVETSEILFNALNRSAFAFYLQVLNFSGRIARLDKWHRPRGSVSDELEVMLAADKISRDLNALWTRRPALLDLADKSDQLRQYLSADLANKVELHLRTYTAGFHACFIHLQRVAYAHLRATEQVKEAVGRIVHLTRLTVEEHTVRHGHAALPVSMLWPLMMAACEAQDEGTAEWIIECIEGMDSSGVGNAQRTAELVREIVRRQKGGVRADARTVMQESFGQVFAII